MYPFSLRIFVISFFIFEAGMSTTLWPALIAALAIYNGIIPPTINHFEPDPECDLDYVPNKHREKKIDTVLSNTYGFGGTNSSIVIRKYQ